MIAWVEPTVLLVHQFARARVEGFDLADLEERWIAAGGGLQPGKSGIPEADVGLAQLAADLFEEADAREPPPEDRYPIPRVARTPPARDQLADRLLGAWQGRAAGCLLGKPVEETPRQGIREILISGGAWPLSNYFSAEGVSQEVLDRWPWNMWSQDQSLLENIDGMPEDDDLDYSILNLAMVEASGRGFQSSDVALAWLANLPAERVFTAERVAYRNLLAGLKPPHTGYVGNPYREWIGAMIRADVYGWINPGDPTEAGVMAVRDATVSHAGDGVWAAVFVASLIAAAMTCSSPPAAIESARQVIPDNTRVAEAVDFACDSVTSDWEETLDRIEARYGHLYWVHSLNNLCLVVAALLFGDADFEATITSVVMGGWDTDSNGATAGSVVGALMGSRALPGKWIEPLNDRITTSLPGMHEISVSDLAARTTNLVLLERPL